MIRKFELGDHLKLKPNKHSGLGDIADVFFDDSFIKHTLEDNGEVKCILCWKQYLYKQYAVFFLMPEGVDFKSIRALKRFVDDAILSIKPKSCITYSFDCDMLNKWHKFLGFERQRKSLLDQADGFNTWLMKWE